MRHWRELLPLGPVSLLFLAGWRGVPAWLYIDLLALLFVVVLACNPCMVLSDMMAPVTRGMLILAVLLAVCGLQIPNVDLYARGCLELVAVDLAALAAYLRKRQLLSWQIKQSPEVDRVLSFRDGKGKGDFDAARAWEEYGCRETRALLHQSIGVECPENLMDSVHKATYMLAFLHGRKWAKRIIKDLKKQIKSKEVEIEKQKDELNHKQSQYWELEAARKKLNEANAHEKALQAENDRLRAKLQEAIAELDSYGPTQEESREAEITRYVSNGHSYADAAERFGVSKSTVGNIVRKAKGGTSD